MKRFIAPFSGEIVCLRLIEESDLEKTLSWRNRDDARVWFKTSSRLALEQHQAWFNHYLNKMDDFLFIVEAGGKSVGQASVYDIQWDSGFAEVGRFLVAPESAGKGYIDQACAALIQLCTVTLGLRYIFLEVIDTNHRAIRIYQKNGFVEENRYDGLLRMSITLEVIENI